MLAIQNLRKKTLDQLNVKLELSLFGPKKKIKRAQKRNFFSLVNILLQQLRINKKIQKEKSLVKSGVLTNLQYC